MNRLDELLMPLNGLYNIDMDDDDEDDDLTENEGDFDDDVDDADDLDDRDADYDFDENDQIDEYEVDQVDFGYQEDIKIDSGYFEETVQSDAAGDHDTIDGTDDLEL